MQAKDRCTIGELQTGDRFYFISNATTVCQVMGRSGSYVQYNIVHENGTKGWRHDKLSSSIKQVVFLRHTI